MPPNRCRGVTSRVTQEWGGVEELICYLKILGCHGAPLRGVRLRDFLRIFCTAFGFASLLKSVLNH